MADPDRKLFAVLIDADNIPAKYAEEILKEVTTFGEPALRRVYGDWSSQRLSAWGKHISELGLTAYQESANTTGKNASDIGLVIDAMDILHSGRFDGFVLVSSDSDFTRLASRIREQGLDVIGIGEEKAPGSLRNVCNRFILIENLVETVKPARGASSKPTKTSPTEAIPKLRRALKKSTSEDDWCGLGELGKLIRADHPDFDTRTYGETKLSDLVKNLKGFKTRGSGASLEVRWVG